MEINAPYASPTLDSIKSKNSQMFVTFRIFNQRKILPLHNYNFNNRIGGLIIKIGK